MDEPEEVLVADLPTPEELDNGAMIDSHVFSHPTVPSYAITRFLTRGGPVYLTCAVGDFKELGEMLTRTANGMLARIN